MGKANLVTILFFLLLCVNLSFGSRLFFDGNAHHPHHVVTSWSMSPEARRDIAEKESAAAISMPDNDMDAAVSYGMFPINPSAIHDSGSEASHQVRGSAGAEDRSSGVVMGEVPKPPPK